MKIEEFLPKIQKNVFLKEHTTFRIGGPAEYFFVAKTKEDLIKGIKTAKEIKLPFFVLGNGSNLLVSDKGYKGLVINFQFSIFNFQNSKVIAGAGLTLNKLINTAAQKGLTGLEWVAGIPGTVGGAVFGNAGAFQKSMKDVVEKVEAFDTKELRIINYKLNDCQLAYKDSIFKRNRNLIIISVVFKLKKAKKSEIKKKIKEYLNYRKESQPLDYPSAGSIFKNYELRIVDYELIKKFPELKRFNKKKQIPTAWLIEKCGLKGKRIGNVQISEKHANFIVNLGNGKANEVADLIKLIKQKVKNKFNIELEEEITILR